MKCDKCKNESTASVKCPLCEKQYGRCDKHGALDGCHRSMHSHAALIHPGELRNGKWKEMTK